MEFVNRHSHPPQALTSYLVELDCDLLVVGHTHRPMWFRCADGLVVNPGSTVSIHGVDSSRTFAMVDLDKLEVTFHDVESGGAIEVDMWRS
jgi:putative phosphoesterase